MLLQETLGRPLPATVAEPRPDHNSVVAVEAGDVAAAFQINGDTAQPQGVADLTRDFSGSVLLRGASDEAVLQRSSSRLSSPSLRLGLPRGKGQTSRRRLPWVTKSGTRYVSTGHCRARHSG